MATTTTKYGLSKSETSDKYGDTRTANNSNFDTIDANLGNLGSKAVDETGLANGVIPMYSLSDGKYILVPIPQGGGTGIPTGGTVGQVLAKKTNADGDVEWISLGTATIGDGDVTDAKIGNRTVNAGIATATANTGTLTQILSWVVKEIKAIKGTVTNWYDTASVSLSTLWSQPNFMAVGLSGSAGDEHSFKLMFRRDMTIKALYFVFDTAPTSAVTINCNIDGSLMTNGAKSMSTDYNWTGLSVDVSKGNLFQAVLSGSANGFKLCSVWIEAVNR